MKVIMLTSMCGPTITLSVGDAYECDAEEAKRLIEAGYAKPANKPGRKKATVEPEETR